MLVVKVVIYKNPQLQQLMSKIKRIAFSFFTVSVVLIFYYSKYSLYETGSNTLFIFMSIIVSVFILFIIYLGKDRRELFDNSSLLKSKKKSIKIYNTDKIAYIILLSVLLYLNTNKAQQFLYEDLIFLVLIIILSVLLLNIRITSDSNTR